MKLGLSQKLTQSLKMTPEMRMAIKILQLNSVELKDQILEVLQTNPVVEIDESKPAKNELPLEKNFEDDLQLPPQSREFANDERDDFGVDWHRYLQDTEATELKISSPEYAKEETSFESFISKKNTLREHLSMQVREAYFDPTQRKIAEYLIGLIDANGYLKYTTIELTELLQVPQNTIEVVLKAIKAMTPAGVGAYDIRECLLLQAFEYGYQNTIVIPIINGHLQNVALNKMSQIAKDLGCELHKVVEAVELIKKLDPKPGASFAGSSQEIYVFPDVFVEKIAGEYIVTLNENEIPRLQINSLYRDKIKNFDKLEKETYDFIRSKLDSARTFLKYVDKRKDTILRVTKSIFEVQRPFLDEGLLHLKPLTLQDIASVTGLHESTVSRATSGKYVQTPRGLFELKFFFSGAARTSGADDLSTQSLKKQIQNIIESENPAKPLSDSKIVAILKEQGITLARRTVAKYRDSFGIPSAPLRKKY